MIEYSADKQEPFTDASAAPAEAGREEVVVIGVGNLYRSDDGLGPLVVRNLRAMMPGGARFIEHSGEGAGLMQACSGAGRVIIVDAVSSGTAPGTIHRIDCSRKQIPAGISFRSSHAFGVAEGIATAEVLGQLPPEIILFGIEASSYKSGTAVSTPVQTAIPHLSAIIVEEILRQ